MFDTNRIIKARDNEDKDTLPDGNGFTAARHTQQWLIIRRRYLPALSFHM